MRPGDVELLRGMKETVEKTLCPDLSSSYAKSRAWVLRDVIEEMLRDRPPGDPALREENARLRELLGYVIERLDVLEQSWQLGILLELRAALRDRMKVWIEPQSR